MNLHAPFSSHPVVGIAREDRVDVFALCEAASEMIGRLSMLNIADTLTTATLPARIGNAMLALRVRFWPSEASEHEAVVRIVNPDGADVCPPWRAQISLPPFEEDRSCVYNLILPVHGVLFGEAGEYGFEFHLDGRLAAQLPFAVRLLS